MTTLGDVCTVRSSLVDPTRPEFARLPHIAPDSIEKGSGRLLGYRTAREDGVTSGKYRFEAGDVLYSKIRPNLNKVALVDLAGVCSADMYALDVDRNLATPEYVAYVLRSQDFLDYATSLSNRANIPKLNREQLLRFDLHLPPVSEQRRIAAILDHADALRTKRRQVLTHLDALTRSIFNDIFADARATSTVEAEASLIRTGPFGSQLLHSEFVEQGIASTASTTSSATSSAGASGDSSLLPSTEAQALHGQSRRCPHQHHGHHWPLHRRTRRHPNGHRHQADLCDHSRLHAPRLDVLACDVPMAPAIASVPAPPDQGSIMDGLNMSIIKAMPIPVPPLSVQRGFTDRARQMIALRDGANSAGNSNGELFASLQSHAFRGEL